MHLLMLLLMHLIAHCCCCCRCTLRLALWRSSKCTLAMEEVTREDQEQHECQAQLKELLEVCHEQLKTE